MLLGTTIRNAHNLQRRPDRHLAVKHFDNQSDPLVKTRYSDSDTGRLTRSVQVNDIISRWTVFLHIAILFEGEEWRGTKGTGYIVGRALYRGVAR